MSDEASASDRSGIQVIARAAAILRALEGIAEGLSLAEIAKAVSLPRSTVHRIVSALAEEGLLMAASPTAKVRLGPGILQLAATLDYDIKKVLRPFLVEFGREVEDTVDLAIPRGGSAVFIDQVPGKRRLTVVSAIGERFPLHCTANGKALLAAMSDEEATRAIERSLKEHPDRPLADMDKLWRELQAARADGLAFDREENSPGIGAVGFALRDSAGTLFAISVPMPIQRFKRTEKALVALVSAYREKIEAKIGAAAR